MTAATDRAAANHHERRAITAEQAVVHVAALHVTDGRRKPSCVECEQPFPCRTARLLGKS